MVSSCSQLAMATARKQNSCDNPQETIRRAGLVASFMMQEVHTMSETMDSHTLPQFTSQIYQQ